jgi:CelD/BcsL family acetyltransferase involved in cellulose biosynthesis
VVATMTIDIKIHSDEQAFELRSWKELFAADPARHVFSTPEWNRVWWEEFSAGKELIVLEMTRSGEPLAIVPLYRKQEEGRSILRFVGGIDLTDYLGPICRPEDRREVATELVAWLRSTDGWDEFDAHNMPVPFNFGEALVEHVDLLGLDYRLEQEETAALLVLPATYDEYLASLDSKERHELKRKRRRIGREHPDAKIRTSTPETLEEDLKTFVDMHRGAEGMKGHFMKPEIATFFLRVARAFMPLGWLRLDFLEIGDTAVASCFGFEIEKKMYLYNSAFEMEARRLSPGLILVSQQIEEAIERGFEVFDFLRGPERYKYQLGAEAVPLNNVRVMAGS